MFILIPRFEIVGVASYPDHYTKFTSLEKVSIDSTDYFLTDYSGILELETGTHVYADYLALNPLPFEFPVISRRSFMRRFTQAERIAMRKSTDDIIIDVHEDLKMASSVELQLPAVSDAISYMVYVGILDNTRYAEILIDGTEEEAWP